MDIQATPKVKLIIGLIYAKDSELGSCEDHLQNVFGSIETISPEYNFDITDYYESEMGKGLKRRFISFERLINADELAEVKRLTNVIEINYSRNLGRSINLDPGYLDMDKFVLASAKYGRQKIYLSKGIYADPTLYFFKKAFHAHDWSFPDFSKGIYDDYFILVRRHYKQQIKAL